MLGRTLAPKAVMLGFCTQTDTHYTLWEPWRGRVCEWKKEWSVAVGGHLQNQVTISHNVCCLLTTTEGWKSLRFTL